MSTRSEVEKRYSLNASKKDDVQPEGVRLFKHPDTGKYQDPREGTVGCPVGPTGVSGATGGEEMEQPEEAQRATAVSREELLAVENLALKVQLLATKKELALAAVRSQIEAYDTQLSGLQAEIKKMQSQLHEKYGIDFRTQQVEAGTGKIISAPTKAK